MDSALPCPAACGAPLGPCIGVADAARISADTAHHWYPVGSLGCKLSPPYLACRASAIFSRERLSARFFQ